MQARVVTIARGARWLGEGFRIFRAAPLGWLALVFAYLFITQLMSFVPLVGSGAAALLVPAFSVGLMSAARAVAAGGRLELGALFDGFRQGLPRQLALGVVYLACILLVLAAAALADHDGAVRAVLSGRRKPEELEPGDVLGPAAVFSLAYAPVMMMFWFAPLLAAWHDSGTAKALFFSFFACLLNWRAFLAYGAITAVVTLALPFLTLSVVALVAGGAQRVHPGSLMIPFLLLLLPTLFASFYASYRDVFAAPQSEAV